MDSRRRKIQPALSSQILVTMGRCANMGGDPGNAEDVARPDLPNGELPGSPADDHLRAAPWPLNGPGSLPPFLVSAAGVTDAAEGRRISDELQNGGRTFQSRSVVGYRVKGLFFAGPPERSQEGTVTFFICRHVPDKVKFGNRGNRMAD